MMQRLSFPRVQPLQRSLSRDDSGNVAMIFALVLLPFLVLAGVAVDLQRAVAAEQAARQAADSASLAAAKMLEDTTKTDAEIVASARAFFAAAMADAPGDVTCPQPAVTIDHAENTVAVAVSCTLPTTLGSFLRTDQVTVGTGSTTKANLTRLDLALMLDVSGSMDGQKLDDLKAAAKGAIDILITDETGDRVRIGFNTYATSVNAGPFAAAVLGPGYTGGATCATERIGFAAFDDAEPGAGKWLGAATTACPTSSVMPLTANRSALKTAIDGFSADGWTAGHLGVAWSWYLIAPDWDDVWPADSAPLHYADPDVIKAVILMTDGEFNTEYEAGQGDTVAQAEALCQAMRDQGVIVYAVAFQAPAAGKAVLQNCAPPSADGNPRFFDAGNGAELNAAYQEIASELAGLRLIN